jgi:ribosome biogenesis GTPase A
MIGETYFYLRSQLDKELAKLGALLRDSGADDESVAIADNLVSSLKEPFVFVVVGEVNVGKSTFLNELFGQDFSRTGVMPTTGKILFFKHGPEHLVTPVTPTLDEVQVPAEFLRDFHIVDTPGTDAIENEHQEIIERFVPVSDLVIFVFSATNPQGMSAWQFLDKVHRHWMRNVIFVLQRCDLRSPEEVSVIIDNMGQLARQRYGCDFPIFPVSASKASLARNSGVDHEKLMQESGFHDLQQHISGLVGRNAIRLNKLGNAARIARQLLDRLDEQMAARAKQARRAAVLVQELQAERELQVDRTLKKAVPALDATVRDYHESSLRIAGIADDALTTKQAFTRPDPEEETVTTGNKARSLDHRLFQDLQQRSGDRWRHVGAILEEDYLQYERFLHAQGRGSLFPADDKLPTESDPDIRRQFSAHIDITLRRFVLGLQLDEAIEPGLHAARRRARLVPWLTLPAFIGVAAAWFLEGPPGAGIAAAGGLSLVGAAFLSTQAALSTARRTLIERLEGSANPLREMLDEQVRQDVAKLFNRFLPLLAGAPVGTVPTEQQAKAQAERLRLMGEGIETVGREIWTAAR